MNELLQAVETGDDRELDYYLEVKSCEEIRRDVMLLVANERARRVNNRRERIATAIFAAMQSNPNWSGSHAEQRLAVQMADALIDELARDC